MEKSLKIVKTLAIVLIAILISVIAFCGLYVKNYGIWRNILPDFKLGMELNGFRELRYVLDDSEEEKEVYVDSEGNYAGTVIEETESTTSEETETQEDDVAEEVEVESKYKKETRTIKANEESNINIENFEKTKKIIQKRLETIDLYEYNIRQDFVTGEIIVELPDDDNIELEEFLISTMGKVEIIDHQTGIILMDNSNIKKATMLGSSSNNTYQAYLQLEFDEEGTEILKEISNEYITVTDGAGNETTNYISVTLDDQTLITTYFGEELDTGAIQIPFGDSSETYEDYVAVAENVEMISEIINGDTMPLAYELSSDNYIQAPITEYYILIAEIVASVIILIISIYLVVRFKLEGLKYAILGIGYIGLLSLVIRYTNVMVTLNSLIAFVAVVIINYVFYIKVLKKLKENENKKIALGNAMKELYLAIIPVCIIAVIFTFMSSVIISSIGMTLFWGLLVQALCSLVILI